MSAQEVKDELTRGCELYCRWFDSGVPEMSGGAMAYEMVSFMRLAIAKLEEEDSGAHTQ